MSGPTLAEHPLRGLTLRINQHPRWSLAILAYVTALVIDPGNLGSPDVACRLQITHSLWKGTPAAAYSDSLDLAFPGRDGKLTYPYGIGQSLLMLPADLVADPVSRILTKGEESQRRIRSSLVGLMTFPLICAASIAIAFQLLTLLDFRQREAAAGALALLYATTFLHYSQVHQENSFLCFLLLSAITAAVTWVKTGSRRALVLAGSACGMLLLTRLTTMLDIGWAGLITLGMLFAKADTPEKREIRNRRLLELLIVGLPTLMVFIAAERLYQFIRFGDVTSTYMSHWGVHKHLTTPGLDPKYPFNRPLLDGFLRQTVYVYKSVFLFDPLLLLVIPLALMSWKRLSQPIRVFFVCSVLFLLSQIALYSRVIWLGGDFAWGNRYLTSSAQLASLLAVPLLMRERPSLSKLAYRAGVAIVAISVLIQISSVILPMAVEVTQKAEWKTELFVVGQRFVNLAAVATGNFEQWNLSTPVLSGALGWDGRPNFFPFLVQSAFPGMISKLAWFGWIALVLTWLLLLPLTLRGLLGPRGRRLRIRASRARMKPPLTLG